MSHKTHRAHRAGAMVLAGALCLAGSALITWPGAAEELSQAVTDAVPLDATTHERAPEHVAPADARGRQALGFFQAPAGTELCFGYRADTTT